MALGGCYTCLKYLMFVFNFIFWLIGCCLLGLGIWAKVDTKTLAHWIQDAGTLDRLHYYAYGIIIVGSVILVLGFLGCCGAIRESQCMLATFFIFLFIIFAALVTIGVYAYFTFFKDQNTLEKEIQERLSYRVDHYNQSQYQHDLDDVHKAFNYECCGSVKGDMLRRWGDAKTRIACKDNYENKQGCAKKEAERLFNLTKDANRTALIVIVAVALSVATIMLLGMIFSMMLCCAVRESVS